MIAKILIGVALVVVLVCLLAAVQPNDYSIARELKIHATAAAVFPYLVNARKSNEWMPWADEDPKLNMSFSGPESGVGAIASWTSEGKMGVGKSEIVEVVPDKLVRTKIDYEKPFKMTQVADFVVTDNGPECTVRWSVIGQRGFPEKIMGLFFDMDKMVGGMFEKGLNKLKAKLEAPT